MPTPPSTSDEFLDLLAKSELLAKGRVEDYLGEKQAASPLPRSAKGLATLMVNDGLLTKYQARQLLMGRHKNFFINHKYKVLERLGSGGMANIFLCEHAAMRRCVAIKVLPPELVDDADALGRFYREAQAVASLNHPNIASAYDIDRIGEIPFMVMEFVDGKNLGELVAHHGPLDPVVAAHYVAQAAEGLQHAHEAGLVHRDVKPANLIVDRTGTVKVLDLGLARFFHEDKDDGLTKNQDAQMVLGTVDYLSPEQALDSHDVDIRGDIYSLGATFYFLLAGRGMFHGMTAAQKLSRHLHAKPKSIRDLRPEVPAAMAAVLDRMLEKQPKDRHQTPAEVAAALATWTAIPIPPPALDGMKKLSRAALSVSRAPLSSRTPAPSSRTPPPTTPPPQGGSSWRSPSSARALTAMETPPPQPSEAPQSHSSWLRSLKPARRRRWQVAAILAAISVPAFAGLWWACSGPTKTATAALTGRSAPR